MGPDSAHAAGVPPEGIGPGDGKPVPPITVIVAFADGKRRQHVFTAPFRIGRGEECEVRAEGPDVSRVHAEMLIRDGRWWVRDAASTNGTFLDGQRVTLAQVPERAVLQLGSDEPRVLVRTGVDAGARSNATIVDSPRTESYYVRHYLEGSKTGQLGQRTIMIRKAFLDVMRKRRRYYLLAIAGVGLLLAAAGGLSLYQRGQLAKQRGIAEAIFYEMKAVEVQLAQLEGRVGPSPDRTTRAELAEDRSRLANLERSYDSFLSELGVYDPKMTQEQRLILRIARVFGECELAMPGGLVAEVSRYIQKWKADTRLKDAIGRANANGCAPKVVAAMTSFHLPPQFFYLALVESDFRSGLCGPQTRFGIPKGAWQFVPETAIAYGLHTGPLYLLPQSDPRDERHDFAKATIAAARYLHDIYSKEAQASGLLVVASYNWGEGNVQQLIRSMPENPRERNFWRLLTDHRRQIPRETYGYVFSVFAGAVIGEDPHLFGFDFDNPLESGKVAR
ncbi:MAG: FHA domain-containing protein [Thermoanaerobaculales bacterium]